MTDYRQLMRLVLDKVPYREIAARQGCSQRTIAKVRRVLDEHGLMAVSQGDALAREDVDGSPTGARASRASSCRSISTESLLRGWGGTSPR